MVRGGTEVIHINFRSAEVDAVYFPQVEVIGDIANAPEAAKRGQRWLGGRMEFLKA